jgi:hypothetical protein
MRALLLIAPLLLGGVTRSPGDLSTSRVTSTGSTTARALKDRAADVVNVKDFGAVGDGVADDHAAIDAAVAALPATGGTLLFPAGTYRITDAITINPPRTRVVGYGAKITQAGAQKVGLSVTGDGVVIEGLWIYNANGAAEWGAGQIAVGVSISGADGVRVTGARIENWARSAVRVYQSNDAEVQACTIVGIGAAGGLVAGSNNNFGVEGYLSGAGYSGLRVIGNWISGVAQGVFAGTDWDGTKINGNRFDLGGAGQMCVYLDNASNLEISDNQCRDAGQAAFKVQITSDSLADSAGVLIANNLIDTTGQSGIIVAPAAGGLTPRFASVSITGNVIRNVGQEGVIVSQADDFSVTDNIIADAATYGIRLGNTVAPTSNHDGRVAGNLIARTQKQALYLQSASTSYTGLIEDNLIIDPALAGTGYEGVYLSTGTWIVRDNVMLAAAPAYDYSLRTHAASAATLLRNTWPAGKTAVLAGAVALPARNAVTWAASMGIDASRGNEFVVTATDGATSQINTPTNPTSDQRITIRVRNARGGGAAMGTLNWGAGYKMATFDKPADGFSRAIDFQYDGTNWIEAGRTPADVPN